MNNTNKQEFPVEPATLDDVGDLQMLLAHAVPACAPETVWELPFQWKTFRVIRNDEGKVIAAGSIRDLEGERAEIRGLAVHPEFRGRGLADKVVERLLDESRARNRNMVCVTRKPSFFERFGFQKTFPTWLSRNRLPVRTKVDPDPRVFMVTCEPIPA